MRIIHSHGSQSLAAEVEAEGEALVNQEAAAVMVQQVRLIPQT
jgi:hypothetical protein